MAYISLVTLGVADLARATAFYEALGWRKSTYSVDDVVSFLAGGTVVLALYGKDALSNDAGTAASASYAINAYAPDEVDETMSTAASAGATVTAPASRAEWGGYVGYFTDLDGHLWEVAHNPDWPLGDEGQVYLPGLEAYAEAERAQTQAKIDEFIGGADDDGQVGRLADRVLETARSAYEGVATTLADQPNNVVIATMLELGRRMSASAPADRDHWVAAAASTMVSSLIGQG